MTRYRSQPALLAAIETSHRRLLRLLGSIPTSDYALPGVVEAWSVKDILAHLAAWQRLLLRWYHQGKTGLILEPSPTGMGHNTQAQVNARIYETNRGLDLAQVLEEFEAAYSEVRSLVASLGEGELYQPGYYGWTGKLVLADYVAANTCQHDDWAVRMLRRWLQHRADS